ncbi:MAG: VanZ family protein [Roseburia sp.]|nr:VanZ family protein [Roseburia sp.]MCM1097241.1 VanZ family protein [Ruminococcus flavefaciens]
MKRKIAVTVPVTILLLALYILIFCFSAQSGEESGDLSRRVSGKCAEWLGWLSGEGGSVSGLLAEAMENPLRKAAHFAEYACMGILVYVLWRQWLRRGGGLYLLTGGWVFLSAGADELHQLFVPGRYGSLLDVLLDTCGGVFGMALCLCVEKLLCRREGR